MRIGDSPPSVADYHRVVGSAVELGANGLLLGPVFASESHGYDTIDYFAVDPRLGRPEDLTGLFAAAHDRGLRVLLDGVFNHVGRRFRPVRGDGAARSGLGRRGVVPGALANRGESR